MSEQIYQTNSGETRQDKAVRLVYDYLKSTDAPLDFKKEDVFVVWYCKTLQNWKALLSAVYKNAPYIEVTHSGSSGETYLDVYTKKENVVIKNA